MNEGSSDFITEAETRVQEALLAESWFQNVPVVKSANGDLVARIDEAIHGLGLFIVLRVAEGKVPVPGDTEDWDFHVVVSENALLNRSGATSGKTARWAVQKIIAAAARTGAVSLDTAREVVAEDGPVVWQLKGAVAVALPVVEED